MTERNKNRKKELEDFLRYSQDQMSDEERNAFERSLQRDPFDAEAMEGLSSITSEEALDDLAGLKDEVLRRTTRRIQTTRNTRTMWYRIAAAVAVLLVVTSVLFTLFNDRMGKLDRKVAESPETEVEAPAPLVEKTKTEEPSVEITAIQSKVMDERTEPLEKKETIQLKSVAAETEAEAEAEIIAEEISEEELAREELAEIRIEETADVDETELAVEEVAPAMAMDRQAAAKSSKREMAKPMQMAGAVGGEQRTLSGMVISREDEQPLPGVVVAVKGSNTGTVTDLEGKFQISIENGSPNTLIAQFIGMETKEIPVEDEDDLMITLEPDVMSPEEVVVFGAAPSKIVQPTGYSVLVAVDAEQEKDQDSGGAIPVGGRKEFNEYVKSNMRFPVQGDYLTRAVVVLNFMVGSDGRPTEVFVLKSPGKAFSDEAIRLLTDGPDWQPAESEGAQIEQGTRIRIIFKKGKL
jgi:outer membrane biosynthesis protein TonB